MVGHTQYDFSDETVIVTGSTKGIGREIADGLDDAGANDVVDSRTESKVNSTAAELAERGAGRIFAITADLGSTTTSTCSSIGLSTSSGRSNCWSTTRLSGPGRSRWSTSTSNSGTTRWPSTSAHNTTPLTPLDGRDPRGAAPGVHLIVDHMAFPDGTTSPNAAP